MKVLSELEGKGEHVIDNTKKALGVGLQGGAGVQSGIDFNRSKMEEAYKSLNLEERKQYDEITKSAQTKYAKEYRSSDQTEEYAHKSTEHEAYNKTKDFKSSISKESNISIIQRERLYPRVLDRMVEEGVAKNKSEGMAMLNFNDPRCKPVIASVIAEYNNRDEQFTKIKQAV